MFLLFIRHAQPLGEVSGTGVADPGLDQTGEEQARTLSQWMKLEDLTAIYSSPARRALETIRPIRGQVGLDVRIDQRFAEFDYGASEYVPIEQLKAEGDQRWQRMKRGQFYDPDIDPVAFRQAVVQATEEVIEQHPGKVIAICTHAGVINAYAGHVLGISTPLWFAPDYTSISRIGASRSGGRSIVSLNETCHLVRC